MNIFKKAKHSRHAATAGFMMVEILVVVAVLAVSVIAAMTVTEKALFVSRQAVHTAQSAFLLEEGAEAVRIVRDNGWANISGLAPGTTYYPVFSGGTWTVSATPSSVGIFTRTIEVAPVSRNAATGDIDPDGTSDSGTRLVTVSVSWPEGGTTITKTIRLYVMDIFS